MLTYCVRTVLSRRASTFQTPLAQQHSRGRCSTVIREDTDHVRTLLQLCADRYYVSPGEANRELLRRGASCRYGPLGTELRRNLLDQWWRSVTSCRAQVFGINTLSSSNGETGAPGQLRIVDSECLKQILEQPELRKEQLIHTVQMYLQSSPAVRTNLLHGTVNCNNYYRMYLTW